jgi:hypothetical protein
VRLIHGESDGLPGLIVDRANGIWLFAGNAATSVQAFYDGGAAFTLGVARASLAALQAGIPADGTVDYCLDAGGKFLARPWTAPAYPFTAAATFGSARAADIASAIVTGRTATSFAAGTVAAFNALQPADCGLYLDDDTTVAAALDRLFSGLGAWWRLNSAGTIALGRWGWTAPALTMPGHRRHAPDRLRVLAPTRRRSLGYARNDRVHSEAEIARILLAGDLAYADGTSVEALKPAESGADVTASAVPAMTVPPATTINFDYTGTVVPGDLPRTLRAVRTRGGIDVSASASWSIITTGCTASIDTSGGVTITACSASGSIIITSVYGAVSISGETAVTRANGAPPSGGGGGGGTTATDSTFGSAAASTYGSAIGGPMVVTAGSAGRIDLYADLAFFVSTAAPAGSFGVFLKWQWRIVGGSLSDVAAEVAETSPCIITDEGGGFYVREDGAISCPGALTGLTPGASYEVQLLGRTPSGTRSRGFIGTVSAVGS